MNDIPSYALMLGGARLIAFFMLGNNDLYHTAPHHPPAYLGTGIAIVAISFIWLKVADSHLELAKALVPLPLIPICLYAIYDTYGYSRICEYLGEFGKLMLFADIGCNAMVVCGVAIYSLQHLNSGGNDVDAELARIRKDRERR